MFYELKKLYAKMQEELQQPRRTSIKQVKIK